MEDKNVTDVVIGGKIYKISGNESEEYIQRVSRFVDKKLHQIVSHSKDLDFDMAAILTSINIADEYLKLQKDYLNLKEDNTKLRESYDRLSQVNIELKDESELLSTQLEAVSTKYSQQIETSDEYMTELGRIQEENTELMSKVDELILQYKNAKEELEEYIEFFDSEKKG